MCNFSTLFLSFLIYRKISLLLNYVYWFNYFTVLIVFFCFIFKNYFSLFNYKIFLLSECLTQDIYHSVALCGSFFSLLFLFNYFSFMCVCEPRARHIQNLQQDPVIWSFHSFRGGGGWLLEGGSSWKFDWILKEEMGWIC